MNLKQFFKECNQKEVFKKLSIYIVSSWILIQVLAITWEPLGLPKKSVTILLIILLIGFPINVYLVWKYHLLPLELKEKKFDENGTEITKKKGSFKKMYFYALSVIGFFSIISTILIIENNFSTQVNLSATEESGKIAVLKFGNNTGDEKYDIISKMAADWIIHGITENQVGQVVSPKIVENYAEILKSSLVQTPDFNEKIIKDYFNPGKIIIGNFYLKEDKLLFQSTIKNGKLNTTLISFKLIECDSDNPIECIEKLKQIILGYLITENKQQLNLQQSPPEFEAYQYVLDAKANFSEEDIYLDYLNKAIALDTNYFEPKLLRVGHFYNNGEFEKADSLRNSIPLTSNRNERQRNLLNLYEALLLGNNTKIYNLILKEYNLAPFDIESNSSTMTIALQYVNKPEDIEGIYKEISMKEMDIENCMSCKYRIYIKGLAGIELKKYKEVIKFLEEFASTFDDLNIKRTLATAYVRAGKDNEMQNLLTKIELISSTKDWEDISLFIGKEYLLLSDKIKSNTIFDKLISSYDTKEKDKNYAYALYYKGEFKKAIPVLENLNSKNKSDKETLTKLAIAYYKNSEFTKAQDAINKLNIQFKKYQFGEIDYYLAQYYAAIEDKNNSLEHLLKSVAQGYNYTPNTFQNDVHFLKYKDLEEFKKILKFWQ
ncbi:hypothetical protein BX611_1211 [Lutibacter oceani]|uniref:Tetratricopeptide repeat protein n=1 Tax=Lutibacter oceani TaxID=1853311 RepID=A0A3D9RX48_9FLAO|nr:hypothetical protein [Lutibacter oceani]REE81676.1 hypothetical protein BX611_1211 [Lutibacter oceani]